MTLDIFEQLYGGGRLPRPSNSALKLARLVQQGQDADFLSALQDDLLFAGELIRYVNTFCSPHRPIDSPGTAASILGSQNSTNLAIILSLINRYRHYQTLHSDISRFWQQALARATVFEELAAKSGTDSQQQFTCSLLNCIGELAQVILKTEQAETLHKPANPTVGELDQGSSLTLRFGYTPDELTSRLLDKWGLGSCIAPKESQAKVSLLSIRIARLENHRQTMAMANRIAELAMLNPTEPNAFIVTEQLAEQFGISGDSFGPFFDDFCKKWQQKCSFFDISMPHCPPYHQMKTMDIGEIKAIDPTQQDLTILVVDDDPIMLQSLVSIVAGPNRKIIAAEGGHEALQLALRYQPHILLTDWRMPDLDGLDLCKIIRKTKITQHTYIIMLTGCEEEEELVEALEAGADDYIIKPYTPKVLQARIRSGERMVNYQLTIERDREVISRYASRLAAANRKLQGVAMTDFLTGLPNRRSALSRLKNLVAEVRRYGEPLSCLMIDIDHFKDINDTYGHDCGDTVLRELSQLFLNVARNSDTVSRWGGEEFIIISARSNEQNTGYLAERLRQAVETAEIELPGRKRIQVTVSIGIGTWKSTFASEDELIKMADTHLYRAKTNGRNRVEPFEADRGQQFPR